MRTCTVYLACAAVLFLGACRSDRTESADPVTGPSSSCTESGEMVCTCDDGDSLVNYTMVYPNGGEVLKADSAIDITFCSDRTDAAEVQAVVLDISPDHGKNWYDIKSLCMPLAPHRYRWTVPAGMLVEGPGGELSSVGLAGAQCLIRVMTYDQYGDQTVDFDTSDAPFTIVE